MVAFRLYCSLSFGQLDHRNPKVIQYAEAIGRTPSALAMKMSNIASLDPLITSTGRVGLGNASRSDRAMWEEMNADWERFANVSHQAVQDLLVVVQTDVNEVIPGFEDSRREGLDRPVETTARVGQSFFRSTVLSAYDHKCCITGLAVPRLLVASHIIPWRHDTATRVNPRNGLLLSALHDRAFDAGLLTIDDDLKVRVYSGLSEDEFFSSAIIAYHGKHIRLPAKFAPDPAFLEYHRGKVFIG